MGKREDNRKKRFETIHRSAFAIVRSNGVEALTIQRLAQEMNWALGSIYRYYPSKEALLMGLELHAVERVVAALLTQLETDTAPVEQLRHLANAYGQLSEQLPEEFALVCLMLGDPRPHLPQEAGEEVMARVTPFLERVSSVFSAAHVQGELVAEDPMGSTLQYWMAIHGATRLEKLRRFDPSRFDSRRLVRNVAQTLLEGWRPPRPQPQEN